MKKNLFLKAFLAMGTLTLLGVSSTASASSVPTKPSSNAVQSNGQKNLLQPKDFAVADKYISINNNQFVFSPPTDIPLSQTKIQDLRHVVSEANVFVLSHHAFINPQTKEITFRGELGKRRKSHEIRVYLWGVRHIFRSNAAVRNFASEIRSSTSVFNYGAALGLAGSTPVALISALGNAYFNGMASQLESFNNHHKKSKINLDIYESIAYHLDV